MKMTESINLEKYWQRMKKYHFPYQPVKGQTKRSLDGLGDDLVDSLVEGPVDGRAKGDGDDQPAKLQGKVPGK